MVVRGALLVRCVRGVSVRLRVAHVDELFVVRAVAGGLAPAVVHSVLQIVRVVSTAGLYPVPLLHELLVLLHWVRRRWRRCEL